VAIGAGSRVEVRLDLRAGARAHALARQHPAQGRDADPAPAKLFCDSSPMAWATRREKVSRSSWEAPGASSGPPRRHIPRHGLRSVLRAVLGQVVVERGLVPAAQLGKANQGPERALGVGLQRHLLGVARRIVRDPILGPDRGDQADARATSLGSMRRLPLPSTWNETRPDRSARSIVARETPARRAARDSLRRATMRRAARAPFAYGRRTRMKVGATDESSWTISPAPP
jgi:hypothetical protein